MQNIIRKKAIKIFLIPLAVLILLSFSTVLIYYCIPDELSIKSDLDVDSYLGPLSAVVKMDDISVPATTDNAESLIINCESTARLFGVLPLKTTDIKVYKDIRLYPGGIPFGIKIQSENVNVIGICDVISNNETYSPAKDAGIKIGDSITKINGIRIKTVDDLTEAFNNSKGEELNVEILRNNETLNIKLKPVKNEEGNYKAGICIKDCTAGIGTVTYINPIDNSFAGLGHGICDKINGETVSFKNGSIMEVGINGINKGKVGSPGEIKGYFTSKKIGNLLMNIDSGVYGVFNGLPDMLISEAKPIALISEVKEGPATIYCTLKDGCTEEYSVEISKINKDEDSLKNYLITVTDDNLLELTGGIIQGMSGSPIIQNGKLIGAVTHVLINDPTKGYGISIENMLKAAETDEIAA